MINQLTIVEAQLNWPFNYSYLATAAWKGVLKLVQLYEGLSESMHSGGNTLSCLHSSKSVRRQIDESTLRSGRQLWLESLKWAGESSADITGLQ